VFFSEVHVRCCKCISRWSLFQNAHIFYQFHRMKWMVEFTVFPYFKTACESMISFYSPSRSQSLQYKQCEDYYWDRLKHSPNFPVVTDLSTPLAVRLHELPSGASLRGGRGWTHYWQRVFLKLTKIRRVYQCKGEGGGQAWSLSPLCTDSNVVVCVCRL